jgi:hypothetical protein
VSYEDAPCDQCQQPKGTCDSTTAVPQCPYLKAERAHPQWFDAPERLSLEQKFRLVEIAHETKDEAVKRMALDLLLAAMRPALMVTPNADTYRYYTCGFTADGKWFSTLEPVT